MKIKKILLTIIYLGLSLSLLINVSFVNVIQAKEKSEPVLAGETFEMIPFYWSAGIIGGVIGLTLSYVSWQKYREEKKKQEKDS